MHACIHTCMHACTHTHACIHTYTHACMHAYVHTCIHMSLYVHLSTDLSIDLPIYLSINISIYPSLCVVMMSQQLRQCTFYIFTSMRMYTWLCVRRSASHSLSLSLPVYSHISICVDMHTLFLVYLCMHAQMTETILHRLRGSDNTDEDTYAYSHVTFTCKVHRTGKLPFVYVSSSALSLPRRWCIIVSFSCMYGPTRHSRTHLYIYIYMYVCMYV